MHARGGCIKFLGHLVCLLKESWSGTRLEIWNLSNATDVCFIFFFCNQKQNLAYSSSLVVSNVELLYGLPGGFMSEVKCWGNGRSLQLV